MKPKHLLFLVSIFILLAGFLYIKKVYMKPRIQATEYQEVGIAIKPNEISAFEIKLPRDANAIRVERDASGVWRLPQKWYMKCRERLSKDFLQGLVGLRGELRSDSKELLSDYGIADQEAVLLTFFDKQGQVSEELLLGINSRPSANTFFRKKDSAKVYLADRDIFSLLELYGDPRHFSIDLGTWADFDVIAFDYRLIDSLKVFREVKGDELMVVDLQKEADESGQKSHWVAREQESFLAIDQAKVREFLKMLDLDVTSRDVADPMRQDYGFQKPYLKIVLGQQDDRDLILKVGYTANPENGDRYIKTGDGFVYVIASPVVEFLDVHLGDFLKDNLLGINTAEIKSVMIKSAKRKLELKGKLLEANGGFIQQLQYLSIERVLLDEKYKDGLKVPAKYSLVITYKDKRVIELDVQKEEDGVLAAQIRGKAGVFVIPRRWFTMVFEDFEKLSLKGDKKK
ncbi:MAG: DUF4340 domain-containing protein [Candidatus Omnitrophota bacterium]